MLIGPGTDYLPFVTSMPYYLAMGACYLAGLTLYINRIPEKFVPGKVDNCVKKFLMEPMLMIIVFNYLGKQPQLLAYVDTDRNCVPLLWDV